MGKLHDFSLPFFILIHGLRSGLPHPRTAVRLIPAIGRKVGETLDFGGLLGEGPVMPVNQTSDAVFINSGGRIPAPLQALKN